MSLPWSGRLGAVATAAVLTAGLGLPVATAAAGAATAHGLGPPNTWVPAGSMGVARYGQTATLLRTGKVLVAGGGTASAELYNPATRSFSATGSMPLAVTGATAVLLHDGKVLVAGGRGISSGQSVTNAELYDPATGKWTATGSLHAPRLGHTATLLPSGEVLVAGGWCNPKGVFVCDRSNSGNSMRGAELYNPATGKWTATGSMRTGRAYQSATLLPDGKVLVAGGLNYCYDGVCIDTRRAELYDPATGTWAATGAMHDARDQHSATLLPSGEVLVAGGLNASGILGGSTPEHAELYHPATGTWSRTAPMATGHVDQTATLLRNGWVLVAGGRTSVAELYEPRRGVWALPGAMSVGRALQTATLLPGGNVLVTGGTGPGRRPQATAEEFLAGTGPLVSVTPASIAFGGQQGNSISGTRTYRVTNEGSADLVTSGVALTGRNPGDFRAATDCGRAPVAPGHSCMVSARFAPTFTGLRTAAALLYDNAPRTPQVAALGGYGGGPDAWVPVGSMASPRDLFSATLLPSGKVLIAGGAGPGETLPPLASAELYDPATRSFSVTGSLHAALEYVTATLLPNGQVLLPGGFGPSGGVSSAELYDPATGTWHLTTPMHTAGYGLTETLLRNGKVLVAGLGFGHSAEVYDPASRTWTDTGPMAAPQFLGTATLLRNGEVLAVGGKTPAAELYNPATNRWTATGSLKVTQVSPAAALLPSGKVLVAGGTTPKTGVSLATSEMYNPATGTWSLTKHTMGVGRSGATATALPDGSVLVAGGCSQLCTGASLASTVAWAGPNWLPDTHMTQHRTGAVATLLPGGSVLMAGGDSSGNGFRLGTAELFTPILMSMRPDGGPAGTRVTVSGSAFFAHETVRVLWNDNEGEVIGRATTTAAGTFTTQVTIPAAIPGRHLVEAEGNLSVRTLNTAQTTFTVTH